MKKSGLFDRNGVEFTDGCKIKTIGWDTHRNFTIVWDQKEAKFQPMSEDNIPVSAMSVMVRDAIVIDSCLETSGTTVVYDFDKELYKTITEGLEFDFFGERVIVVSDYEKFEKSNHTVQLAKVSTPKKSHGVYSKYDIMQILLTDKQNQ